MIGTHTSITKTEMPSQHKEVEEPLVLAFKCGYVHQLHHRHIKNSDQIPPNAKTSKLSKQTTSNGNGPSNQARQKNSIKSTPLKQFFPKKKTDCYIKKKS